MGRHRAGATETVSRYATAGRSRAIRAAGSDFCFPHDAVKAEATPNTETTLIADLDLSLLRELGLHGWVRNLRQRRLDLYRLGWCGPVAPAGGTGTETEPDAPA